MSQPENAGQTWFGLAEQKLISPKLLAWISLPLIFVVYQGLGAALMLLTGGGNLLESIFLTRLNQGLSQILFLILPVFFLIRLHTRSVMEFTFLKKGIPVQAVILIPLSILFVQPLILSIGAAERLIPWPDAMLQFRDQLDTMMKALVGSHSVPEFLFVALIVSVIPAFAEEFYFRGYLLRNFSRVYRGFSAAVLTGVLFGLFHFNPFQITGLILLGIYFSLIVWYFQSLWAGVLAHFTQNFLAVLVYFIAEHSTLAVPLDDPDYQFPLPVLLVSLLLTSGCIWGLFKLRKSN